jgi:hypothetical protein
MRRCHASGLLFVLVAVLLSAAAEAETSKAKPTSTPTPAPRSAYSNEDLERRHPTPTPPELALDGQSTATAPPTPTPTRAPLYGEQPPSLDMDKLKARDRQLEAATQSVEQARKRVAEVEAKLAAASSLARPNSFGLTNPEVPAIQAELEQAKQNLAAAEASLEQVRDAVERIGH